MNSEQRDAYELYRVACQETASLNNKNKENKSREEKKAVTLAVEAEAWFFRNCVELKVPGFEKF